MTPALVAVELLPAFRAAISGLQRSRHETGPEMSSPITPVLKFSTTPGHFSRMASAMVATTSGSQVGIRPNPGRWSRKWQCMMLAPAL